MYIIYIHMRTYITVCVCVWVCVCRLYVCKDRSESYLLQNDAFLTQAALDVSFV